MYNGTATLKSGTASLSDGTVTLKSGTDSLKDGTDSLKDGTDQLVDGIDELRDGAEELHDGMKDFKKDGIDEICNLYKDNVPELVHKLQALQKLGKDYESFSGISADADGKVKFLFRSDAIKADE